MGLTERLGLVADDLTKLGTKSVEKREESEHNRKQWVRGAPTCKKSAFNGRVLHVDDILIRGKDGKLHRRYVRDKVTWKNARALGKVTTCVKRIDYKEKLMNGEKNPQYGHTFESNKTWQVVIFKTDNADVGEFRVYGEKQQVPLVRELALVYAAMMSAGVFPTYIHENGGLCIRGKPLDIGTTEDDLETVREKFHLSMARATSTASTWIREKFYRKYGPEVGERLARAELKKMLAKPAANPDNLWGYGLKNKDTGEYDRLNLGGKYPTDKPKRSKNGGKGGGGAFKVGSEPPVIRDMHKAGKKEAVEENIRNYVMREMVKNPIQAEADLAVRKYKRQLGRLAKEKKHEEPLVQFEVLDVIERRGMTMKFCKQGRRWVILDHKEAELFGSARKSDVQTRWTALKKGKV